MNRKFARFYYCTKGSTVSVVAALGIPSLNPSSNRSELHSLKLLQRPAFLSSLILRKQLPFR